jgi:AraC-like DNA-binding protein
MFDDVIPLGSRQRSHASDERRTWTFALTHQSTRDEERIQFLHVPDLPGVELMLVENTTRLYRWFHESYDLCIVPVAGNSSDASSSGRFRRWGYSAMPGSLLLMEPGDVHVTTAASGRASYWIAMIPPAVMMIAAAELGLRAAHFTTCHELQGACHTELEALRSSCLGDATALERQSRLAMCIQLLLTHHCEKPAPDRVAGSPRQVRFAHDYLVEHFARSVSLDELVAVTGVSRFHLIRSFSRQYGLPPHKFQIHVRVERARALLRDGVPLPLIDVGFADQSHLTRHFKRVFGTTPAAYQSQVRR